MSGKVSSTRGTKKSYYGNLLIPVTPYERMLVEYYAYRYNRDISQVVRGMVHKYSELDENFDLQDFAKWAEKKFIPAEDDAEMRGKCKQALARAKEVKGQAAGGRGAAAGTSARPRK